MIGRKFLIPLRREFGRIKKNGRYYHAPSFDLLLAPSPVSYSRFAFVVSKKVAPRSVDRHKLKRQLVAAAKATIFPKSCDAVFIAKKPGADFKNELASLKINPFL